MLEDPDDIRRQAPVGLAAEVGDVDSDPPARLELADALGEHVAQQVEVVEVRGRHALALQLLLVLLAGEVRRRRHDEGDGSVGDPVHLAGVAVEERIRQVDRLEDGLVLREHGWAEALVERRRVVALPRAHAEVRRRGPTAVLHATSTLAYGERTHARQIAQCLTRSGAVHESAAMANVVLVHGICHGAWCWDDTVRALTERGHQAVAVDLPLTSLTDDAAAVRKALDEAGGPVVLVGHSYGGLVISSAAAGRDDIAHLVYVAAVMVPGDDVFIERAGTYPPSPLAEQAEFTEDGQIVVSADVASDCFYQLCDEDVASAAAARHASDGGRLPRCADRCRAVDGEAEHLHPLLAGSGHRARAAGVDGDSCRRRDRLRHRPLALPVRGGPFRRRARPDRLRLIGPSAVRVGGSTGRGRGGVRRG